MGYKHIEDQRKARMRSYYKNERDLCSCGNVKQKRAQTCQSCFLKYRLYTKERNLNVSKAIKGRIPWSKGFTKETDKRLIGNSDKHKGFKNSMWKGDEVGYEALHRWIARYKPKPQFCERCKQKPPYDLANISGEYKRDINDFEWLCRSCHMKDDKRLEILHENNKKVKNEL